MGEHGADEDDALLLTLVIVNSTNLQKIEILRGNCEVLDIHIRYAVIYLNLY